jgi:hypothetical protein
MALTTAGRRIGVQLEFETEIMAGGSAGVRVLPLILGESRGDAGAGKIHTTARWRTSSRIETS